MDRMLGRAVKSFVKDAATPVQRLNDWWGLVSGVLSIGVGIVAWWKFGLPWGITAACVVLLALVGRHGIVLELANQHRIENEEDEFRLVFEKVAATPMNQNGPNGHAIWSVMFKIYNHGAQCRLRVSVVDQSVRYVHVAYPDGSFPLRWQTPSDVEQVINRGGNARVDVAWVEAGQGLLWFLGPPNAAHPDGVRWKRIAVNSEDGYVEGLIDIEELDRDRTRRLQFRMSTGLVDPVDLVVTEVDHPAFPPSPAI